MKMTSKNKIIKIKSISPIILLLLLIAITLFGCVSKKGEVIKERNPITTQVNITTNITASIVDQDLQDLERAINDTREIENFMNELQQLENLSFDVNFNTNNS